jgi:hypothetical protein
MRRVGFGPRTPAPGPITFRLRLGGTHPVLEDSDGVGFETIRYYLIINTIKDLYCAVLREIATTCNYAVTNCHGIYFPHFQYEILPKMPSPFETKFISIRPLGFRTGTYSLAINTTVPLFLSDFCSYFTPTNQSACQNTSLRNP